VPFATSILVPTDLSPASYAALSEAARIASLCETQLMRGSEGGSLRVTLLHVFDVAPFRLLPQGGTLSESTLRRIAEEANGAAHTVLLSLRARFFAGRKDIQVAIVEHDGAAAGICDCAERSAADLIVMASHGRAGRSSAAHGSVTAKVVRAAPCRVLVVPSDDPESHTH
jgi:nucleotide-binding universal stress UspA family protein